MKCRKYAEGGLVVSRGGRDTSGLRLFDDTPATGIGTARAVAEMAAADEVGARPTMEELQAANLAAVRAREAQRDEFDSRFGAMQRTRPPAMLALKKGGPVKKADLMKKMAAAKKAPAKKMAAGGMAGIKKVKGYATGGKVGCGHKGMKKK